VFERSRMGRTGRDPDTIPVIRVLAGTKSSGEPAFEQVPADPAGDGRHVILATPGLARGVAAGDVVELDERGEARVVESGSNVGVQIYSSAHDAAALAELLDDTEGIGGWLDGYQADRLIVLKFPAAVGLPAIEALVEGYSTRNDAEWGYANR
jgi:hypothetical protein